jgi:putative endonuclease
MGRHGLGTWGEETAARFLVDKGFRILDRNWHASHGELDLVAQEGETLVFVEVKARHRHDFGSPEEAITPAKQRKLRKTAWTYLQESNMIDVDFRFDVVAIDQGPSGEVARLEHYVNAIGAESQGQA